MFKHFRKKAIDKILQQNCKGHLYSYKGMLFTEDDLKEEFLEQLYDTNNNSIGCCTWTTMHCVHCDKENTMKAAYVDALYNTKYIVNFITKNKKRIDKIRVIQILGAMIKKGKREK